MNEPVLQISPVSGAGKKITMLQNDKIIGRVFLYLLKNDLHSVPFGFIEDVFVESEFRGQGIGTKLVNEAIAIAKKEGCYKVICTSRYGKEKVHEIYKKIGFIEQGIEFRINFN